MAALGNNALLRAQFPTLEVRQSLQKTIELKALADIADPMITVLVVKEISGQDDREVKVVAFAKWSHPVCDADDYIESPWIWPEGTCFSILDAWTWKTDLMLGSIMGGTPCYRE
jgi:hypothetical protein